MTPGVTPTNRAGAMHGRLLLLLLVVALLWLAGCDDQPAPTPTPTPVPAAAGDGAAAGDAQGAPAATPTPDPLSGRLVLWHSWAGADGDALAAVLDSLAVRHPELLVDTLYVAYDDLAGAYADAVRNGGGPDLVVGPNWWLNDLQAAGAVRPLDDLLDPAATAQFWPAALENLRRDGVLYGIPNNVETVAFYVNTNLAPDGLAPATTEDLLNQAAASPQLGPGLYTNLYHLAWALPAFGSRLMDEQGVVALDTNGGAAAFLTWLKQMNDLPGVFVSEDYGMLLDRFKKGEFAYFVDGPWAMADLRGALGDALAVAPLPAGPVAPAQPWLSADGYFLNPGAGPEQQRLALAFALAATHGENGAHWAQQAGRLPANRDAAIADPLLQGFAAQAASAQAMPHQPQMDQVWGYAGDMLLKVLNDVMAPQDAVDEATALINDANGVRGANE